MQEILGAPASIKQGRVAPQFQEGLEWGPLEGSEDPIVPSPGDTAGRRTSPEKFGHFLSLSAPIFMVQGSGGNLETPAFQQHILLL